jgi:hypothetical protein
MAKVNLPRPAAIPTTGIGIPPPARMPAGITSGTPPLPPGRVVQVRDPKTLTPKERQALERIGWEEGSPIPTAAAPAIRAAQAEVAADIAVAKQQLAVDPSTPPTVLKTVNLEDLPPEQQSKYNQIIDDAMRQELVNQAATEAAAPPKPSILDNRTRYLDLGEPARVARPAPAFVPPGQVAAAATAGVAAGVTAAINPKAQQATSEPVVADPVDPVAPHTDCPHCGWDLRLPDIPEPETEEKQAFLQSVLGQKPYCKEYPLMGGALTAVFRTLTQREIDACFQQCYRERDQGKITTGVDFFTRLNRFRLYLQLQRLRSSNFDHDMPDGLSIYHAPQAATCWQSADGAVVTLEQVEDCVLKEVLRTETLCRVAQQSCDRFNRLTAKMEGMVDNTDFWKATGAVS